MKICAIVLDYRSAARTEACLQSLLGQGLTAVLLVDNSADAQASRELDAAMRRLQAGGIDYALHIRRPQTNFGFARGVNFALKDDAARCCDAFLLLNNDATATSNMVPRLATSLVTGEADLVAPLIIDDVGNPQPILWYQRFFGLLTAHRLPSSFYYFSGCCLLFRRELLQSGKLFDEDFFMYGEDTLLGWQMIRDGKAMLCNKDAVVRHIGHGSSQQGKMFYEYHMARAHVLLALKTWRNPLEIPLLLFTKVLGLALRALQRSRNYRSATPLLAFFLAWLPLNIRAS